ncbi:MAG: radical SAM protein [Deltaproteobacteria bacterium]|nr:radical SAM protein [Deltaproteobacteria bacterium]
MQSVDSWAAVWPPLTLGILAAIAKKHAEVGLLDCHVEDLTPAETMNIISEFSPDVVVVNCAFPSIDSDDAFAQRIKQVLPSALVLGFGVFFTLLEEKALQDTLGYDVGIYGEPEETFDAFLTHYERYGSVVSIPGLLWRNGPRIEKGPPRPFVEDLDTIPSVARDLFRNDRYRLPHNGNPFTLINVARGCPYPCSFCIANIYYGKKPRIHSVNYVINEIETCIKDHGIKDFLFWEEVFTLHKDFSADLCREMIRRKLNISWATTTRADLVDEQLLLIMKRAGCELLGLGIESCSQQILDNAKKQETVSQIRNAVALCRKAGMPTMGHFIFGLPGETEATARSTISYAVGLGLDFIQCYCAVPYPKTPLGELARERGWIQPGRRWSDYDFGGRSIMNIGTVSPDDVDRFRRTAFRRFYLRPGVILNKLKMITSPRQLIQAAGFLKWMRTRR